MYKYTIYIRRFFMPFDKVYNKTMVHEGGYVNDPVDRGGETYRGISRRWWPYWRGWKIIDSLKPITDTGILDNHINLQNLVRSFYETEFWIKPGLHRIDKIEPKMAEKIFDTGINVDMSRACKWFQISLNLLNRNQKYYNDIIVDGKIGPKTALTFEKALKSSPLKRIVVVFAIHQGEHYKNIMISDRSQEKYVGWFDRVYYI